MVRSLDEIKRHNRAVGQHFFDRGNPPVVSKKGHFLVTSSFGGGGFVIYKYDPLTGKIRIVNNPEGDYPIQPYPTKRKAVAMAKEFNEMNGRM